MFKRDHKTQNVIVPFGERTTFNYFDENGQPLRVLDFHYLTVAKFTEGLNTQKDVFMAYLEDGSFVVSSSMTGTEFLRFKLPESMIGDGDKIIDMI